MPATVMSRNRTVGQSYWRANLKLVGACLGIWFAVSFGCGVLLVDVLNQVAVGGFKLGFWFAQQGSMVVFLGLVAFYAWRIGRIDRSYGVAEAEPEQPPGSAPGNGGEA